jgi:O-antigen/teichoic acid export membrane protein
MPKSEGSAILVYRLSLLSAIAMAALAVPVVLACGLMGYGPWSNLLWIPVIIIAQGFTYTFIGWCNRRHFFGMQSTTKVILAAGYPLLAAMAYLAWGAQSANLPAAYTLASLLGAGIFAAALHRARALPAFSRKLFEWRSLRSTAYRYRQLPLLSMPGFTINMASFVALVTSLQMLSAGTSASFSLVFQILRVPAVLVGMAVGQVFTAKAATLIGDPARLRRLTFGTAGGLTLLAIPFALLFTFFGPFVFTLIYGQAWVEAGEFSRWLAWGAASALVITPLGLLPTLLHSNRGQLLLTILIAGARCVVAWMATHGASVWTVVIGSTLVDLAAAFFSLGFVLWLLRHQSKSMPPPPSPALPVGV